ncbi:hypothetical protein AVEN_219122-1, partial [Araneus ventricosus]
ATPASHLHVYVPTNGACTGLTGGDETNKEICAKSRPSALHRFNRWG